MNKFLLILKKNQKSFSIYLILIGIFLSFGFLTDFVNFRDRNITNILIQNSYIVILAMGMVLVIITGNIDLSVGSLVALTGAISALTYNATGSLIITFGITILSAMLLGMVQGACVAYLKIPSFIVTLAGMLSFRGLTMVVTQIRPIGLSDDRYKLIATGFVEPLLGDQTTFTMGIGLFLLCVFIFTEIQRHKKRKSLDLDVLPMPVLLMKIVIVCGFILWGVYQFSRYKGIPNVAILLGVLAFILIVLAKNTTFGRAIYAVGGNAKSAKLSGINAEKIIFYVFILMGALGGISGIVYTSYMNQALSSAGNMFELDAISAAFIGGASASGGVGTIGGAIIGALTIGIINNGMIIMSLGAQYQYLVKAFVLLAAVWYDLYNRKKPY